MSETETATPSRSRGRWLLLMGLGLAVLGPIAVVAQLSMKRVGVPWYMPALAFTGAALVVVSLRKRLTAWRVVALVLLLLLGGLQVAVLTAARLPPYTGPIAAGRPFPAFEAKRADGTPFTQASLVGDRNSVLVFFRGRW